MLTRVHCLLASLALTASLASAGVKGYGAFPVTPKTLGLWLNGENGDPVIMVYYHGPPKWSDRHWDFNFQFDHEVGLHEYKSRDLTLHVRVDLGAARRSSAKVIFFGSEQHVFGRPYHRRTTASDSVGSSQAPEDRPESRGSHASRFREVTQEAHPE